MESKKLILTTILALLILAVHAQSDTTAIVREHYPLIYKTIQQESERSFPNNIDLRTSNIDLESKYFLRIAESRKPLDAVALTEALLYGSIAGEEQHNIGIINDTDIENPYPLLRCNWYVVNKEYGKLSKNWGENLLDGKATLLNNKIPKAANDTEKLKIGAMSVYASAGITYLRPVKGFQTIENSGMFFDLGWSVKGGGDNVFLMWQNSLEFVSYYSIYKQLESLGNTYFIAKRNEFNLTGYLYYGGYFHVSNSSMILIAGGAGGGLSLFNYKWMTNNKAYPAEESSKKIYSNWALSGLVAFQHRRSEFTVRYNWGVNHISIFEKLSQSRTLILSVGYLF